MGMVDVCGGGGGGGGTEVFVIVSPVLVAF